MSTNIRLIFILLVFFCAAGTLFSQAPAPARLTHRFTWPKDEFTLRYEVLIEKEENGVYGNAIHAFTEEPYIYFTLLPGNYRFRIIPYDFLNIPGQGTRWRYFRVVHAVAAPDPSLPAEEPQLVMEDVAPPTDDTLPFIDPDFVSHRYVRFINHQCKGNQFLSAFHRLCADEFSL